MLRFKFILPGSLQNHTELCTDLIFKYFNSCNIKAKKNKTFFFFLKQAKMILDSYLNFTRVASYGLGNSFLKDHFRALPIHCYVNCAYSASPEACQYGKI